MIKLNRIFIFPFQACSDKAEWWVELFPLFELLLFAFFLGERGVKYIYWILKKKVYIRCRTTVYLNLKSLNVRSVHTPTYTHRETIKEDSYMTQNFTFYIFNFYFSNCLTLHCNIHELECLYLNYSSPLDAFLDNSQISELGAL